MSAFSGANDTPAGLVCHKRSQSRKQCYDSVILKRKGVVKTLLLTLIIGLTLVPLLACGGEPSRFEIARKTEEVVPLARELVLEASFSPEEKCREMAAEFAAKYEVSAMPYEDEDPKEQMSKLEKLGKGLDDFEKDLEKADCPT